MSRSDEWAIADLPRGMRVGLLCAAVLAPAAASHAQSAGLPDAVIVNWDALDALGAVADKPGTAAVRLIAPPRRVVAVMPPPQKPAEPAPPATPAPTASAVPPPPSISPVPAAAAPAPGAPATQQIALASVPRAVGTPAPVPNHLTMVRYAPGSADIPDDGRSVLDAAAASLAANPKLRLQIVAYASGNAEDAIAARRLSLTRAVQMRAYLIARNVPSIRMEVRALGDQNVGTGPADRVDLVIVDR